MIALSKVILITTYFLFTIIILFTLVGCGSNNKKDEQDRQKRVANCTVAVQQALRESNCDLDVTVVLRAGQVIPRIAIVPVEVIQAQRNAQQPPA